MASKPDGSWQARPEFGDRIYRRVDTRVWNDGRVRRFSTKGRLVWLYLLTAPNTTSLPGLYKLREEEAAAHCGLTLEGFREGFAEPFREGMVEADWDAGVVWLRKAPRHEWPTGPNVVKGWRKVVRSLPESPLVSRALAQIRKELQGVFSAPEPFLKAFADTFPEGFHEPTPTPMATQESVVSSQDAGIISSASQAASAADAGGVADDTAKEAPERPALELLPSPPDVPEKLAKAEKKARALSKAEMLYVGLEEDREVTCRAAGVPFIPLEWPPARINKQLGAMARVEGADADALNAAFEAFLDDPKGATFNPPWDLGMFVVRLPEYKSKALRAAGGAA